MKAGRSTYRQEIRALRERLGCDFAALALVHGVNRPLLTWDYATGSLGGCREVVEAPGQGVAGLVYARNRPLVMEGTGPDGSAFRDSVAGAEGLESLAALPLTEEERVCAVLLIGYRTPGRVDGEAYSRILDAICPQFCGFAVAEHPFDAALADGAARGADRSPAQGVLTDFILQAQEDERQRISRELHDSVVQDLLSVQMALRTVKYQEDRADMLDTVNRAEESLGQIQKQLRNMAVSLRPVILDDLGLAAAFRSHFQWIESAYGVAVQFTENVTDARYPRSVETVFYRVCQEAVLNACKYARCDRLSVTLLQIGGGLTLEVGDNGVGFDPAGRDGAVGIGLRSMAERAELIGAELWLDAAPGQGTRVRLAAELEGGK